MCLRSIPVFLCFLLLSGCASSDNPDYAARQLGLELPPCQTFSRNDSHGGFHGDGLLRMELTFSPEDGETVAERAAPSVSSGAPFSWAYSVQREIGLAQPQALHQIRFDGLR